MRKLIVDCLRLAAVTALLFAFAAVCRAEPQAAAKPPVAKLPVTGPAVAVCPPTSHIYAPRAVGVRFLHVLPSLPVVNAIHGRLMSMAIRKPARRVLAAIVYSHPVRAFVQNHPRVFRWR